MLSYLLYFQPGLYQFFKQPRNFPIKRPLYILFIATKDTPPSHPNLSSPSWNATTLERAYQDAFFFFKYKSPIHNMQLLMEVYFSPLCTSVMSLIPTFKYLTYVLCYLSLSISPSMLWADEVKILTLWVIFESLEPTILECKRAWKTIYWISKRIPMTVAYLPWTHNFNRAPDSHVYLYNNISSKCHLIFSNQYTWWFV